MSNREDFEIWAKSQYAPLRRDSSGDYWVETTQASWEAWQASRAAVVIKLPKRCDKQDGIAVESEEGDFYHRHDVREAIEAAGIKCK